VFVAFKSLILSSHACANGILSRLLRHNAAFLGFFQFNRINTSLKLFTLFVLFTAVLVAFKSRILSSHACANGILSRLLRHNAAFLGFFQFNRINTSLKLFTLFVLFTAVLVAFKSLILSSHACANGILSRLLRHNAAFLGFFQFNRIGTALFKLFTSLMHFTAVLVAFELKPYHQWHGKDISRLHICSSRALTCWLAYTSRPHLKLPPL
jgi:hypothetical protein